MKRPGASRIAAAWQKSLSRLRLKLDEVLPWGSGRRSLWAALIALVLAVLATLVWLAGRYEASQVQAELERDTVDAVNDLRNSLSRQVQALQALQSGHLAPATWQPEALGLLRNNRDWLRIEWRTKEWRLLSFADSPLRAPAFERIARPEVLNEATQACQRAKRLNGPAYSSTYFLPQIDGLGMEVMELCLPVTQAGEFMGYTVVTYSLQEMLTERLGSTFGRRNELSFIEPDGTRLAIAGTQRRERRVFTAQQLVDLPGNTLLLRMDGRRGEPDLFPNVLTALVTGMSIALITVMILLTKDSRRRLKAERDLADALAFRKAMEDSLFTGLRARDLEGRITYVNPAFCDMVGLPASALIGRNAPMPYWPPEMVDEYKQRQAIRLAGNAPPRGVVAFFVVLATGHCKAHAIHRGRGCGQRTGATNRTGVATDTEAVPVRPSGRQPVQLHVHGVAEFGMRHRRPLAF